MFNPGTIHRVSGTEDFTAVAACGGIVLLAEPVTVAVLRRWEVIDVPGGRSSHTVPTPRGGGLPIAAALLIMAALARYGESVAFAAAVGLLGALGLADDLRTLPARTRLVLQAARQHGRRRAAGDRPAPADRRRGRAGRRRGVDHRFRQRLQLHGRRERDIRGARPDRGAHACYGAWAHHPFMTYAGLAVALSALLFLPWNAGRAWVFLGDVGSYTLGAALAVLAARAVLRGIPAEAVLGPLAVYLADTAWTLQRRIRQGEPWLQSHRTHVYQQWCNAGWSHQEVTLLTGALAVLLTLLGAVSLTHDLALRAAVDLTALALLAGYLRSPAFFRRLGWEAGDQPAGGADHAAGWAPGLEGRLG